MIIAGVLCILIGYIVGIPLVATLGWILLVIGVVLLFVSRGGNGRRYY